MAFAEKASKGEVEVKGKRIGLNDFTKNALDLCGLDQSSSEVKLLNAQWLNNSTQNGALGKMIAMVDVSGSMAGDPLNAAIALGIRIAEKSILGKRVLTFSSSPNWVNLESCTNFVDSVRKLQNADWGMSTDFCAALNLILLAIVNAKLPAEEVEDMVLTILSDMQMNSAGAFSDTMIGVQFHPEATKERLIHYFNSDSIKTTVVNDFSEDKWNQIMQSLEDDSKIKHTCSQFIPNFLQQMLQV